MWIGSMKRLGYKTGRTGRTGTHSPRVGPLLVTHNTEPTFLHLRAVWHS